MAASNATAAVPSDGWTLAEHARFLDGLERYGGGSTGQEWAKIATLVATRTADDVQRHAWAYFMKLRDSGASPAAATAAEQAAAAGTADVDMGRVAAPSSMSGSVAAPGLPHGGVLTDTELSLAGSQTWTAEQDELFESALARTEDDGKPGRWETVASAVPGKSAADVRERYRKLLLDVAAIESEYLPRPPVPATTTATTSAVAPGAVSAPSTAVSNAAPATAAGLAATAAGPAPATAAGPAPATAAVTTAGTTAGAASTTVVDAKPPVS